VIAVSAGSKAELTAVGDRASHEPKARSLHFTVARRVWAPDARLSVNRGGVANVKRIARLEFGRTETVFTRDLNLATWLRAKRSPIVA